MSLSIALLNGLSGLRAAQTALMTVSTNVANVNTDGYSRKTVSLASVELGGLGAGVDVTGIRREVQDTLLRDSLTALSDLEQRRSTESLLSRVAQVFGTPGDEQSLSSVIGRFRDAMQSLAEQPENSGLQSAVVQRGREVATLINSLARELQTQRLEAERGISAGIATVNQEIDRIVQLNKQISQAQAIGQSTADLEDKRDLAVRNIAKQMDVRTYIQDDGQMVVSMGNGRVLAEGNIAHPIDYSAVSQVAPNSTFDTIDLDGFDITNEIRSGALAGLIELRDTTLPATFGEINQLAQLLRSSVTSTGLATTNSATDPGADANLFFIAASTTDYASTLQVHPDLLASPALLAGTPTINLQIARDLADAISASTNSFTAVTDGLPALTSTFAGYADSILGEIAGWHAQAKAELDYQETFSDAIEAKRGSVSDVNMDEELSQLLLYQKAYAAAGRIVQTTNDMFDVLINTVS